MIVQLSNQLKETGEESKVYEDYVIQIYDIIPSGKDWTDLLYIKVYTKDISGEFTKLSRISMFKPEYINCEFENNILEEDIIKHLINVLQSYREESDFDDNITIWQLIIRENNIYRRLTNQNIKEIPMNFPIPDYTLLKEK